MNPPVPEMAPTKTMVPAPVAVSRLPPLSTAPKILSCPASDPIIAADPSVMLPLTWLTPEMLRNAPKPPAPLPLSVIGPVRVLLSLT